MTSSIKYLKFEKDQNNRWFVVLPEWNGERDDLEMVCGADSMLDILSQGETEIEVGLSVEKLDDCAFKLDFIREEGGGAWYRVVHPIFNLDIWLCKVTIFVLGNLPKTVWVLSQNHTVNILECDADV